VLPQTSNVLWDSFCCAMSCDLRMYKLHTPCLNILRRALAFLDISLG
jgi:hypothetical protein